MHGNNKIDLLCLSKANDTLGEDIATHIAASAPLVISSEDLDKDLAEERKGNN